MEAVVLTQYLFLSEKENQLFHWLATSKANGTSIVWCHLFCCAEAGAIPYLQPEAVTRVLRDCEQHTSSFFQACDADNPTFFPASVCGYARNPTLDKSDIERYLRDYLGVELVLWLGQGVVGDVDTDGHIDNLLAFVRPGEVT